VKSLAYLPFVGLMAFVLFVAASSSKPRPQPSADGGAAPLILAPPQGYRRADQGEVTTAMQQAAVNDLDRYPLGSIVYHDSPPTFAIGIESHYDAARGWHKGASVFVKGAT
jgi:hypothetical protein